MLIEQFKEHIKGFVSSGWNFVPVDDLPSRPASDVVKFAGMPQQAYVINVTQLPVGTMMAARVVQEYRQGQKRLVVYMYDNVVAGRHAESGLIYRAAYIEGLSGSKLLDDISKWVATLSNQFAMPLPLAT